MSKPLKEFVKNFITKYSNNEENITEEEIKKVKEILAHNFFSDIILDFTTSYFNFLLLYAYEERNEIMFELLEWINSDNGVESLTDEFCNDLFILCFGLCTSSNKFDSFSDFIIYIIYQISLVKQLDGIIKYINWYYPNDFLGINIDYCWYKIIERKFPNVKFGEITNNIKLLSTIDKFINNITYENYISDNFLNKYKEHFHELFNYIALGYNIELFNIYFLSNDIFKHIKTFAKASTLYFPPNIYRLLINDERFTKEILYSSLTKKYLKHYETFINIDS